MPGTGRQFALRAAGKIEPHRLLLAKYPSRISRLTDRQRAQCAEARAHVLYRARGGSLAAGWFVLLFVVLYYIQGGRRRRELRNRRPGAAPGTLINDKPEINQRKGVF